MRKIIFILFCFFAVTTFAQQKKTTKTKAKTSTLSTSNKKQAVAKKNLAKKIEYITCSDCKGDRMCKKCKGQKNYICWETEHDGYESCDDSPECFKECSICGSYERNVAYCTRCVSGSCRTCNGIGYVKIHEQKK